MEAPFAWPEIYQNRRNKVRQLMLQQGLDALVVFHPANRFYLSGFELHDSQPGESAGFIVLTQDGNDWLATDPRYADAAARIWPQNRIFIYSGAKTLDLLLPQCGGVIGIESEAVSWHWLLERRKRSSKVVALMPVGGLVEIVRVVKEPCEIAALKKSFALNHKLLAWLSADLKRWQGISERELAWEVEKFFRENGAQELAFATIAAFGKNGALPHAIPSDQKLGDNQPLLLDLGCRVNDYCSDQTRTWWIGDKPAPEFEKTLELVKTAQQAALAIIRPGVACADVYQAAYDVFAKAGAASAFTHGLGHGVGLETHEAPSLNPRSKAVLEKNMVVTVEPGLYYSSWGGVRWEHTIVVEENGPTIL